MVCECREQVLRGQAKRVDYPVEAGEECGEVDGFGDLQIGPAEAAEVFHVLRGDGARVVV